MADPLSVPCPYCKSPPWKKCGKSVRVGTGPYWQPIYTWIDAKRPHKARIRVAEMAADEKSDG